MSATRMPWEIQDDVRSHDFRDRHPGEQCARCGVILLTVAFFGGYFSGEMYWDSAYKASHS